MSVMRSDVVDAIKAEGWGISYRGFINSKDEKLLAVDPISNELDAVKDFIDARFPQLKTEVISCRPYRELMRIIVSGF